MTDEQQAPPGKVKVIVAFDGGWTLTIPAKFAIAETPAQVRDLTVAIRPHGERLALSIHDANTSQRIEDPAVIRQFVEAHLTVIVAGLIDATTDPDFHLDISANGNGEHGLVN